MRRAVAGVIVVVAALVLTACPDDGDPTVESGGTTTSTSTADTSTSSTGPTSTTAAPGSCPANTEKQIAAAVTPRANMTALRAAHQPGFDRIVFEFTGTAPGFEVEYVDKPLHEDGSGNEVPLRGQFALHVRMENASGYDFEKGAASYTGPNRIRPADTTVVEELARTGDFEGVLSWAIGVKAKAGFRVRQLTDPPRLQIEVCAAP